MYAAKRGGRNLSVGFDPEMESELRRKTELSSELKGAIERRELALHYQPQIDARSGATIGFEALLRWTHPRLGEVPPSEFIPIAEESGQLVEIGEWVLRQACREAVGWPEPRTVSVNISPGQLTRPDFVPTLKDALARTGLSAPSSDTRKAAPGSAVPNRRAGTSRCSTIWSPNTSASLGVSACAPATASPSAAPAIRKHFGFISGSALLSV